MIIPELITAAHESLNHMIIQGLKRNYIIRIIEVFIEKHNLPIHIEIIDNQIKLVNN